MTTGITYTSGNDRHQRMAELHERRNQLMRMNISRPWYGCTDFERKRAEYQEKADRWLEDMLDVSRQIDALKKDAA